MFVNVFVKDTWSFCHINQYLLLFIHFAQTAVFYEIQQTCIFIYLYKYIYMCIFLMFFVLWWFLYSVLWIHCHCGRAHAVSRESNTGNPNRWFCFCFILMLFTVCHLIRLASDCLQRYMHGNVTLCIHRVSVSRRLNTGMNVLLRQKKQNIKK